jgi:AraC-like DNA-binding protein
VLVRRGLFQRAHRDEALVANPNHVLLFNAAQAYRYAHPLPGGDDCTILAVETPRALDLVARHSPHDAQRPETPFARGHGLSSPRTSRLHWELFVRLRVQDPVLVLEDAVAELAEAAIEDVYAPQRIPRRSGPSSARAVRLQREMVEAAKVMVSEGLATPPSLGELAARLGTSPFHLSRTFHRVVGLSLRKYVKRLRARASAASLAAGAPDLTELALSLGYADHSHFTNSFREEWGRPPSALRALARRWIRKRAGRPG